MEYFIDKNDKIDECIFNITSLFQKYKDNDYMFMKTYHYICNQLPNILENIQKNHEERMFRMETMTEEQDSFIEYFLNTNRYFYVSATEKFFLYDGFHYKIYKEDDILYNVLNSI